MVGGIFGKWSNDGYCSRYVCILIRVEYPTNRIGYPDPPTIGISPPPSTTSSLPLDPSSFQVLFNTLHPPEDHSFIPGAMGGKIPGFVYGQSQPGPSTPSVQTTNTNIDPLGGMGMTPNFDPAQFIWAVSNQLPQIEDSSPYDERTGTFSGGSGVSPHLGEVASRNGKGKGKGKEMDGEGSKLVKITWWRPHGAVSHCIPPPNVSC
jgi:hypothetical protein